MTRKVDDDIGFDEHGQPFMLGEPVALELEAIISDPNAKPILVVAEGARGIGVRVFGPPSETTAELLDHIAATYRRALATVKGPEQ